MLHLALLQPPREAAAPMLQRRAPAAGVAPARSRLAAPRRGPSSLVPAAQGGSFDNEGELDYGLSRELESLTARDKFAKLSKHLELLYQASKPEAEVREAEGRLWVAREAWRRWVLAAGAGAKVRTVGDLPARSAMLDRPLPCVRPCSARWSSASPAGAAASTSAIGAMAQARAQAGGGQLADERRNACNGHDLDAPAMLRSAPLPSHVCRRHDDRGRAVLLRGRVHPLPRLQRQGGRLKEAPAEHLACCSAHT